MKALQLLPGVQYGNEGTYGMYVRGGAPAQNLILPDGVSVYNANHLFGFFSVFNTDAINNVEMIKGGFPARYGGRLSSVIVIQMKEGSLNEPEGEAADVQQIMAYNFRDLNGKVYHIFSPKDRIYLSAYAGRDKYYQIRTNDSPPDLYEKENSSLRWGYITSAFRWNHKFSDRLFSNLTAIYTSYQFDLNTTVDVKTYTNNDTSISTGRKNTGGNVDIEIGAGPEGIDGARYLYLSDNGFKGESFSFTFILFPPCLISKILRKPLLILFLSPLQKNTTGTSFLPTFKNRLKRMACSRSLCRFAPIFKNGLGVFAGYSYSVVSIKVNP